MNARKILILTFTSALLLSACFGGEKEESKNPALPAWTYAPGPVSKEDAVKIEQQVAETQRIVKLDTLTDENLKTQTEEINGKTTLKDRRLLVNYLKSKGVNTIQKLIEWLEEIENFTSKEGVDLSESDIRVVIAGFKIENQNWDLCENFNTTKASLDSNNKYYAYIGKMCNNGSVATWRSP